MKYIFCLGNPGLKYRKTRHNAGFMAADYLAGRFRVRFRNNSKLSAAIAECLISGEKTFIVKPQTYMNNSGYAVSAVLDYYGGSEKDIIVIYDDIDIQVGSIRVRAKGSAGTHNGMRNIIEYLETENFARVRIGIGSAPGYKTLVDHVLGKFLPEEQPGIEKSVTAAGDAAVCILEKGVEQAQAEFNGK